MTVTEEKNALRHRCAGQLSEISPAQKAEWDRQILRQLLAMPEYGETKKILIYVSTDQEPDTRHFFVKAREDGKSLFAPYCRPGADQLDFYPIESLGDLRPGAFGILEPDPQNCEPLLDFEGSLCLVPGVAFDEQGFRLGHGKGYYDRFLPHFPGITVGVCFTRFLLSALPRTPFDIPVRRLVTENGVYFVKSTGGVDAL